MDRPDHDTRVGAYAVLVDDRERILLALWNEGPTPAWTVPGGGPRFWSMRRPAD